MKKMVKALLVIISIGVVSISLLNTKRELKEKDVENKKLAVFIKQEDGSYKTSTSIPQIGYTLNIEKSTCSNGAKPTWSNNTLKLSNLTSENTNCYLYFDEEESTKKLKELGLTANTTTPDFSQIATEDEGIFGEEDGMYGGTSYYWRGAATTNYLKFGGFCWRIVRINGDGSIRLIYDGSTCHVNGTNPESVVIGSTNAEKYYATSDGLYNNSSYVGWTYTIGSQRTTSGTASNAKIQTEKWYNANITGANANKVADGKYCNDRNVGQPRSDWEGFVTTWSATGTRFAYAGVDRLWNKYQPTLNCPTGDIYTLKVGAITADEVEFAGGKNANNTSYYLYNEQNYWTMSPNYWNSSTWAVVFFVNTRGHLDHVCVNNTNVALRPVINLKTDTVISSGNGTIDNPFIVEGAE